MTYQSDNNSSKINEISIIDLWEVLFKDRFQIIFITFLFGICSIIYALTVTELWKPEVTIYPSEKDKDGASSINSALSQFISPVAQDSKSAKHLAILLSRNFLIKFIQDEKIEKELFEKDWNLDKGIWKDDPPSKNELYRTMKNIIEIDKEEATGIIRVSITWHDKEFASSTANKLINKLNNHIRLSEVEDYRNQLKFIEEQIKNTNLNEVKLVLFNIVEKLTSNIMIAETKTQYAFKIIDYAYPPEYRFFPQRTNLVLLWTFIGFFLSCILSILINIFTNLKKNK